MTSRPAWGTVPYPPFCDAIRNHIFANVEQSFNISTMYSSCRSEAVDINFVFCSIYIKPHFGSGMIQTISNARLDKNIPQLMKIIKKLSILVNWPRWRSKLQFWCTCLDIYIKWFANRARIFYEGRKQNSKPGIKEYYGYLKFENTREFYADIDLPPSSSMPAA